MSKTLSPCFLATKYGGKEHLGKMWDEPGSAFQIDLLGPSDGFRLAPGSGIAQIQVSAFRLRPPAGGGRLRAPGKYLWATRALSIFSKASSGKSAVPCEFGPPLGNAIGRSHVRKN